jgi:single-stranded DNA-binding protein
MNIKGKLIEKFDTQDISDKFRKREFVLEYAENPQYPEFIKMELVQSNCEQLDQFKVGDDLVVQFNLKGRKWTDPQGKVKYFNSLQAWRLENDQQSSNSESGEEPPISSWTDDSFSQDEDLPF